jgi:hypothetical protein
MAADYLVLLPREDGGIDYGAKDPIQVRAVSPTEAIEKAAVLWWGSVDAHQGVAIVVELGAATAYDLTPRMVADIRSQTNVPNQLEEI